MALALTGTSAAKAFDLALREAPVAQVTAGGTLLTLAMRNLSGFFQGEPWNWGGNASYQTIIDGQAPLGPAQEPRAGDIGGVGELVAGSGGGAQALMDDAAGTRLQLLDAEQKLRTQALDARGKILALRNELAGERDGARAKLARLEQKVIDARRADVLLSTTAGFEESLAGGDTLRRTFVAAGVFGAAGDAAARKLYTMDYLAWLAATGRTMTDPDRATFLEDYQRETGISPFRTDPDGTGPMTAADPAGFDLTGNRFVAPNPRLVGQDILTPNRDIFRGGRFTDDQIETLIRDLIRVDRDRAIGIFSREAGL